MLVKKSSEVKSPKAGDSVRPVVMFLAFTEIHCRRGGNLFCFRQSTDSGNLLSRSGTHFPVFCYNTEPG